jgi:hypothetical protein
LLGGGGSGVGGGGEDGGGRNWLGWLLAENALAAIGGNNQGRRRIPSEEFGVKIKFWPNANNPIDPRAVETFVDAVAKTKLEQPEFDSLLVTATTNAGHDPGGFHPSNRGALAVDVGAINDIAIRGNYGKNPLITGIAAYSEPNRPPIPTQIGHGYGANRPPLGDRLN